MARTLSACLTLALMLCAPLANAADIRHGYGGDPTNSFYIDDAGGSVDNGGNNNSYYLNLHDIDQSALGTLFLYSDGSGAPTVDDGLVDQDFENGGGIFIQPLSVLDAGLDGEIGLGSSSLLLPVSFDAGASGLAVEQVSYTSNATGDEFVIVEYRVINTTGGTVAAQLALSNDFDVDLKSADAKVGFENTVAPLVYQQEAPPIDPNYTTVGVSLIEGVYARHRLESCSGAFGDCEIFADDGDVIRQAFFQDASGQVGDLTQGVPNQDFAVTISADLGSLAPGEAASVVFCYNLGNGSTSAEGISDCRNSAQGCRAFYETEIQVCDNGLVNFGEACDDGNANNNDDCPDGTGGTCQNPFCGDGFTWNQGSGTETCDDGNAVTTDSCPSGPSGTCKIAYCGDGFTQGGVETCDDGNASTSDACPSGPSGNCLIAICGDGFIRAGVEVCDDGNVDVSDNCPSGPTGSCQNAFCGDGFIHQGLEGCDDGNTATNDACPSGLTGTCQLASCGDGFVRQGTEVCDPGISGANCTATCTSFDSCGDGNIDAGEACDDGNANTGDACPSGSTGTCQSAICGDGYLRSGVEACDDGNAITGDGCSASCQIESGGGPGNPDSSVEPTLPFCGNDIVEADEMCDGQEGCNQFCRYDLVLQGGGVSENTNPVTGTSAGCSHHSGTSADASSFVFGLALLVGFAVIRKKRA